MILSGRIILTPCMFSTKLRNISILNCGYDFEVTGPGILGGRVGGEGGGGGKLLVGNTTANNSLLLFLLHHFHLIRRIAAAMRAITVPCNPT